MPVTSQWPPVIDSACPAGIRRGPITQRLQREFDRQKLLAADLASAGAALTGDDLAAYHAHIAAPLTVERAGAEIHLPLGLNAGPTYAEALARLPEIAPGPPGPAAYGAYADALAGAYARRFETLGHDGDTAGQGSTTHISVADGQGNLVALTNTLVSLFGAKVLLPRSGLLMNNAVMWFDPTPGRPNSLKAGVRPLCNMCPLAVTRGGRPWFALGASGGRRILPAVFQVASFLVDCGLSLDEAVAAPRLNVDGSTAILADRRLPADVIAALEARYAVKRVEALVSPNYFANPLIAMQEDDSCLGAVPLRTPVAGAVGV